MRFALFILAFLLAASTSAGAAQGIKACPLALLPAPVEHAADPVRHPFCVTGQTSCSALKGGGSVCTCQGETDPVTYLDDGAAVVSRPDDYSQYGLDAFRVLEGDIDGDGRGEITVARFTGMSNGIGYSYWTLTIAEAGAAFAGAALSASVNEFGPESFAARTDGKPGCRLLATEWGNAPDETGGTWLMGRWFDIGDGALIPDRGGQGLKRRLLDSFEHRWRSDADALEAKYGLKGMGRPVTWLTDPKARPMATGARPSAAARAGVLRQVELRPKDDIPDIVRLVAVMTDADGAERIVEWSRVRLAEAGTGQLFPRSYTPAQLASLTGRRILIEGIDEDYGDIVLWLDPA